MPRPRRSAPKSNSSAALNNLAQLYGSQGRDVEAELLFKRAIAMLDKTAGLESPENASALNNLAALYPRRLAAIVAKKSCLLNFPTAPRCRIRRR
jgi:tetratricopeptide (TPR) repeat protein